MSRRDELPHFLADTWWYGLTDRMTSGEFDRLAKLRLKQGFSAIQLVMGVPPEVRATNRNAYGNGSPAWNRDGEMQLPYVEQAVERLKILHNLGLTTIIYGGWGDQIDQIGDQKMTEWWKTIVETADIYDPIYCLTGEIDIAAGKSTIFDGRMRRVLASNALARRAKNKIFGNHNTVNSARMNDWGKVFGSLHGLTHRPIICHTTPSINSDQSIARAHEFSAFTVQTGHNEDSRNRIWALPVEYTKNKDDRPFINLEPWYEGINDNFYERDQLYAFWSSMLGGSHAYCYGAQGVWNAGDGRFRNHWGSQTFEEAIKLETPARLGNDFELFFKAKKVMSKTSIDYQMRNDNTLISISQRDEDNHSITFFPNITADYEPKGLVYSPAQSKFVGRAALATQVVEFNGFSEDNLR